MQRVSIERAAANGCRECARLLVEHLGELGVDASTEALAQVLEDVASDSARGFVLVAREKDRVVGVAYVATILSMEHCGQVAWLEELYVTPDCRHRGVGTALVSAVLEQGEAAGLVAIDLEVDAAQRRAISFYQRLGFRRLDRSRMVRRLRD